MVQEYQKRRDVLVDLINDMPMVHCLYPEGAFYVMLNIVNSGLTDVEFSKRLLQEEHVATCPGSYFGEYGAGYIRICFANSMSNIKVGMSKMKTFLEKIRLEKK